MGKIIPFPENNSGRDKKKPERSGKSAMEQLRDIAQLISARTLLKMLELPSLPIDLVSFTREEKLRELQQAFEISSGNTISDEMKHLSEFLIIRRYILALIVDRAARRRLHVPDREATENKIETILDRLAGVAEGQDWDWVSFNESEYDFFHLLGYLTEDPAVRFLMNRARENYLGSTLTFDAEFWNMKESLDLYRAVWQRVKAGDADDARATLLKFYEENDKRILFYYEKHRSR